MPILTLAEPEMMFIACAAALVAGMVRGFVGFGGASTMMLILTQFYEPTSVLARVAVIDIFANVRLLPTTWREVERRTATIVTLVTCIILPIGFWLLVVGDPVTMKRGIAAVVAICALALLSGKRFSAPASLPVLIAVGVVCGLVLGATFVALVFMVFVYALPLTAAESRATGICWSAGISVAFAVTAMFAGVITWADLGPAAIVGLVFLAGAWTGAHVFRQVDEALFRRIVLVFLLVLASIGLVY